MPDEGLCGAWLTTLPPFHFALLALTFGMGRSSSPRPASSHDDVNIVSGRLRLEGILDVPANASGLVIFAHGSGSSRRSIRNQHVAQVLQSAGLATLLFDLLTKQEEWTDAHGGELRFDVELLASRLQLATEWAAHDNRTAALRVGYFGASTGAAAALIAAAGNAAGVGAVVSRGGRPDLAGQWLRRVQAPTLLIIGGADEPVIPLNEQAYAQLGGVKRMEIVPGATHLFEEPGKLDVVAGLAARWFSEYLPSRQTHHELRNTLSRSP